MNNNALIRYAQGPEMTIERANDYRIKLGLKPLTQKEYDDRIKKADKLNLLFEHDVNRTKNR